MSCWPAFPVILNVMVHQHSSPSSLLPCWKPTEQLILFPKSSLAELSLPLPSVEAGPSLRLCAPSPPGLPSCTSRPHPQDTLTSEGHTLTLLPPPPPQTCSWRGGASFGSGFTTRPWLLVPEQALAMGLGQWVTRLLGAHRNGPFPWDAWKLNDKGNPVLSRWQARASLQEGGPVQPQKADRAIASRPVWYAAQHQVLWRPCFLEAFQTRATSLSPVPSA